jgi:hypothetical protein
MVRHLAAVALGLVIGTTPLYAQPAVFTVTTPSADVYKAPSMGSVVIGKAPRGESFEVTRDLGSWVRIAWPDAADGMGFVHVTRGTLVKGGVATSDGEALDVHGAVRTVADSASRPSNAGVGQPSMPATQRPATSQISTVVPLPAHRLGLGARMGSESFGFAATGRVWPRGRLGAQVEAGRTTQTLFAGAEPIGSSTSYIAPSVMYSPRDWVGNALWLRPYVGSGVQFSRLRHDGLFGEPGVVDSGLGYQAFGGAEFTWANLPQFAMSADLRRQWTPDPMSGPRAGRFGFSLSGHWYVR